MGGMGSGRGMRFDAKQTTSELRSIDVRRWKRDGILTPGKFFLWSWVLDGKKTATIFIQTEDNKVVLTYRHRKPGGEWKDENYSVSLSWSACNYGGKRPWFHCPVIGCNRRVALLYSGSIFACRHCLQLAYESQSEDATDRAIRHVNKIRYQLNWLPGIINGEGYKPKSMHWDTYFKHIRQHRSLINLSMTNLRENLHNIETHLYRYND